MLFRYVVFISIDDLLVWPCSKSLKIGIKIAWIIILLSATMTYIRRNIEESCWLWCDRSWIIATGDALPLIDRGRDGQKEVISPSYASLLLLK